MEGGLEIEGDATKIFLIGGRIALFCRNFYKMNGKTENPVEILLRKTETMLSEKDLYLEQEVKNIIHSPLSKLS